MKNSNKLALAALTGLLTTGAWMGLQMTATAEEGKASCSSKEGCKGKDMKDCEKCKDGEKAHCKGEAGEKAHCKGQEGEKASCKGKEGCKGEDMK